MRRSRGPDPSGQPTQYPIILEHGFNASPSLRGFVGVDTALSADGHKIYVTDVPPFRTAEDRALVSSLGYGDRVASITTISTPHRGSAIADRILAVLDGIAVPATQ